MVDGPEGPPAHPVKGRSEGGCPCRGMRTLWEDAWASRASEGDVLPCCLVLLRTRCRSHGQHWLYPHSWEALLSSCLPSTCLGLG